MQISTALELKEAKAGVVSIGLLEGGKIRLERRRNEYN